MAKQKYIIFNNLILFSTVDFHSELLPKENEAKKDFRVNYENHNSVKGGGYWHVDHDNKVLLLYSCSTDFGFVEMEDLLKALPETSFNLEGYHVFYSQKIKLDDAIPDMQPLNFVIITRMKSIIFIDYAKVEGFKKPEEVAFCLNELSERRYRNEAKSKLNTSCGLLCDEKTFKWFEERQVHGVVIPTPEQLPEVKEFHFYKEIGLFS